MMATADKPIRTRHDLMPCPVCHQIIAADVQVEQVLGTPAIDLANNAVTLPVEAKMVRFEVNHECPGPAQP